MGFSGSALDGDAAQPSQGLQRRGHAVVQGRVLQGNLVYLTRHKGADDLGSKRGVVAGVVEQADREPLQPVIGNAA